MWLWYQKDYVQNISCWDLFINFSKVFDFIHKATMEQIFLAYDIPPQKNIFVKMMLYKNTKVMVPSLDCDTVFFFFNIVAEVFQGDTFA